MIRKWLRKAFPNPANVGCFLVSMVVLGTLGMVFVGIARESRKRREIVSCLSNLRHIGIGIAQYSQDNYGTMPTRQSIDSARGALVSWRVPINRYVKFAGAFRCPANPAAGDNSDLERDGFSRSYAVNSTNDGVRCFGPFADKFSRGLSVSKMVHPENVILVTETTAAFNDINPLVPEAFTRKFDPADKAGSLFHTRLGGTAVLYGDGHTHYPQTVTRLSQDAGEPNPWTINGAPFAPADQAKLKRVLDFAQKQDW